MTGHGSDVDRSVEWDRLRATYLRPVGDRPRTSARGLHHMAVLSSDVERTIAFYQDVLEFPLAELFENRDYRGSTHFFFDIGNGNYLAYFDFPGLDLGDYAEVLGGLHHIAISVTPDQFDRLVAKVRDAGVEVHVVNGDSAYFPGPDGERLELLSYPLHDMYGTVVGP
ncbi:MAG: VOC family protein [Acidimicrobiales bacterium]|jgi:catechol 2,3-dioxygenase-like lactoylglutathione lyase family enzyme